MSADPEQQYFVKGLDPIRDLLHCLPGFAPAVVFDVGANVGQSAAVFAEAFPQSEIHCFEPVSSVFAELATRFADTPRVHCTQCALGATSGPASISLSGGSTMHSLTTTQRAGGVAGTEQVEVRTLDELCGERAIAHIDLLKIDTEGFDLEVLRGAAGLLAAQQIDVVGVEAGMNPENATHVPFETLKRHLEEHGYRLFAIYEQKEEWPTAEPHLRRTNPLFLSRRTIDRYQGHSPGSPP
ncbi:FkbM family methyltransferase [Conexibacter sp. CPCC 206217]|uniref:FkbM family methyltransferase n=1 Tax=Conexibacter sp. CPCC 206217 TaxID=3064574 RepID=UPI00271ABC17|nr:FkbM family methyltransferase [Conexibacter sp. CPCC 206217]MDO8209998.1 FkbM family methyltransferase [Conexibacter sp. CPCC 206217]